MSAFGIIQLHEEITRSNGYYCSVCFRSSLERRLVKPVSFTVFLSTMGITKPFKKLKVCYLCEALAASAVRFQNAVQLAARVGEWYDDITRSGQWQAAVRSLNKGQGLPDCSPKITTDKSGVVKHALSIDSSLRAAPRFDLHRTDTLVVSTQLKRQQSPPVHNTRPDTVVIVDDTPSPVPAPAPGPRGRSTMARAMVLQEQMQMRVMNHETNEYILHPMVKGIDGNVYVPSLQLQICDDGILKSVPDLHIQKCLPSALPLTPQNLNNSHTETISHTTLGCNKVQRNNVTDKKIEEKNNYYNFLLSQMQHKRDENGIKNVEVIKMNDMNIVLHDTLSKKRKIPKDPLSDEHGLSEVQHILNENVQGACEIKYELLDEEPCAAVTADSGGEVRLPVLRTDRTVDWEDKIPMDVISFVDATDPNPQERIMQPPAAPPTPSTPPVPIPPLAPLTPLGVISDVWTLPPDDIECIDLC